MFKNCCPEQGHRGEMEQALDLGIDQLYILESAANQLYGLNKSLYFSGLWLLSLKKINK